MSDCPEIKSCILTLIHGVYRKLTYQIYLYIIISAYCGKLNANPELATFLDQIDFKLSGIYNSALSFDPTFPSKDSYNVRQDRGDFRTNFQIKKNFTLFSEFKNELLINRVDNFLKVLPDENLPIKSKESIAQVHHESSSEEFFWYSRVKLYSNILFQNYFQFIKNQEYFPQSPSFILTDVNNPNKTQKFSLNPTIGYLWSEEQEAYFTLHLEQEFNFDKKEESFQTKNPSFLIFYNLWFFSKRLKLTAGFKDYRFVCEAVKNDHRHQSIWFYNEFSLSKSIELHSFLLVGEKQFENKYTVWRSNLEKDLIQRIDRLYNFHVGAQFQLGNLSFLGLNIRYKESNSKSLIDFREKNIDFVISFFANLWSSDRTNTSFSKNELRQFVYENSW